MQEFNPETSQAKALLAAVSPGSQNMQKFYKAASGYELDQRMKADAADMTEQGFTLVRTVKVGRNEVCPCGSGRKFKKCCLVKAT